MNGTSTAQQSKIEQKSSSTTNRNGNASFHWQRLFGETHPYDSINWETRTAKIVKSNGQIVFEQRNVEVPNFWTQTATDIVASKYFRGKPDSPDREYSAKQMIDRVAKTVGKWGLKDGYFASAPDAANFIQDLTWLLINQYAAFNSPVWFNVGVFEKPQCSACQPYRALISSPHGFFKIGEIVENKLIGLPIYDSVGTTKVIAVKNNGVKRVYKVILRNGAFIETTGDHLVRAVNERRTKPLWIRVDQLKKGMRLHLFPHRAIADRKAVSSYKSQSVFNAVTAGGQIITLPSPVLSQESGLSNPHLQLEISEAALAGWLQADGFVGQYKTGTNRSLTIEFLAINDDEKRWIESHLRIVFPEVHRKIRVTKTKRGTPITRIRLYGEKLRYFVGKYELLKRGKNIRVPDIMWKSNSKAIAAYLRSVFQGEGYVSIKKFNNSKSGRLAIATISRDWIYDIQILLFGLGIYSRVKRKLEKRSDRMDLYELSINNGSEKKKFQEAINFISNEKQTKLISSLTLRNQKNISDLREEEVISIDEVGAEPVYDIQTESGEYLTNNVVVHNCFILSVDDNIESILEWYRDEGMIFRGGSGSGTSLTRLRSSREPLSRGGFSSGPVSFMKGADGVANSIRSGGTTRRAAKMVVLDADHPDIKDFIYCKKIIEDMTKALALNGFKDSIAAEIFDPYTLLPYQNANNSVRVTDAFMRAVEADGYWELKARTTGETLETLKAREIMDWVADAAWHSADPGMQYDTTINEWHTCPNTGRINASNPCFTGDTLVYTDKGLIKFSELYERFNSGEKIRVYTHNITSKTKPENTIIASLPTRVMTTGKNSIYKLSFSNGLEIKVTENHKFWTGNKGWVKVKDLKESDQVKILDSEILFSSSDLKINANFEKIYKSGWGGRDTKQFKKINLPSVWTSPFAEYVGYMIGDGSLVEAKDAKHRLSTASIVFGTQEDADELLPRFESVVEEIGVQPQVVAMPNGTIQIRVNRTPFVRFMKEIGVKDERAHLKRVPHTIFQTPKHIITGFLRGLFSADGCVYNGANYGYVGLGSVSKELLIEVQQLLLSFGIFSRIYETRKPDQGGFSYKNKLGIVKNYKAKQLYDLRIAGPSMVIFKEKIGFLLSSKQEKLNNLLRDHEFYKTSDKSIHLKKKEYLGKELTYNLTEPINHSYLTNGIVVANCSEYMHLDNSACNLASLNLTKFLGKGGKFDVELFKKAVDTMILAQDILVDNSSYPTPKITENAKAYRELGLGYANLGSLLMLLGLPYDSEAGRMLAGHITSLMCGEAYRMSALIADCKGSFAGYQKNKDPMLGIIAKHLNEAEKLYNQSQEIGIPDNYLETSSRLVWHEALDFGKKYGVRNSQVTVLAPTGTISFLMDCATTGVEPDLMLVKYKKLVGGGTLKLVNNQVPVALRRLGYLNDQIEEITNYILETGTIEDASYVKDEHLPVFDCSFKAHNGTRSISYMGHLKMMAAVQPFISGAISKTINLPADATIEDVKNVFIEGWRLGLKAVAIYRDGSKSIQPLNTKDDDKTADKLVEKVNGYTRRKLPDERPSITHKFSVGGYESYLTVGFYPDTMQPGETFLTTAKEGSTVSGLFDTIATLISMALQSGVPLKQLVKKFKDMRFDPAGFTENPDIPTAKSIVDYVFRYLGMKYLSPEDKEEIFGPSLGGGHAEPTVNGENLKSKTDSLLAGLISSERPEESIAQTVVLSSKINSSVQIASSDAPVCQCGTLMVRAGACFSCPNCFATTGVCN